MQKSVEPAKISVIIPTYNRAAFIGEAIQSVLDQTYPAWEIIVLDDGSTDDTAQVVAQFNGRATYICQKNAGETAARSAGFYASRGDFVAFLDSDDRMLPHNLETLMGLLQAHPEVDVAYGWYYWMDQKGKPIIQDMPRIKEEIPPQIDSPWPGSPVRPSGTTLEGQILPQLVLEETMLIGSVLIRRPCVEAVKAFDPSVHFQGHWDFFLRLAAAGSAYVCSRQGMVVIRLHPGNRGQNKEGMLTSRLFVLDRLFDNPALQTSLAGVRNQAYYNTYVKFAEDYYALGLFKPGAKCLNEAMKYAPLNSEDTARIAELINAQALTSDQDPYQFVEVIFEEIDSTAPARGLRHKVLGKINAGLAFRHYQSGQGKQALRHTLSAIRHDPALLRNRGLARVGLEGALGSGVVGWVRSQKSPISNDLLGSLLKTPILFISPHFDDVVLSCGGTLAHLAQRQAKISLITVFTADAASQAQLSPVAQELHRTWGGYKDPFKIRSQEDKATADYLKIEYNWLEFHDAIYRYPTLGNSSELFLAEFKPDADPCFEAVRQALQQVINAHPRATIFAPLGLGYHRDHLIVCQALQAIKETNPAANTWYYYEDYPYAATANLPARLAELDGGLKPVKIDIRDTFEDRVNMIMMHRSQMSMLFNDLDNVRPEVLSYAARVGTRDKPQERFWHAGVNEAFPRK